MAAKIWPLGRRKTRRRAAEDDLFGPEYSVVRLRASWTALAYLCTLLCLSARYWMGWVHLDYGWRRPFLTVLAMLGLSVLGTISAWVGHRRERNAINKIAILLNLVALALSLFAIVIVAIIVPSI